RRRADLHAHRRWQRGAGEALHLCQDLLQRQRPSAADARAAESQDPCDEITRPIGGDDDVVDVTPLQAAGSAVLSGELGVTEYRAKHVVEVVGYSTGECAERFELL